MVKAVYQGVPGMLRPFKEFVEHLSLPEDSEIVFYGVPGTCSPFVELLCYTIRSKPFRFIFVPYTNEEKARLLKLDPDIGFLPVSLSSPEKPAVIVIMGGLAMPNMPTTVDMLNSVVSKWKGSKVIGVCFMHMFEKAGWLDKISFDLLIDAVITVDTDSK